MKNNNKKYLVLCLSDTKRFSHYWISGGFVTDPFLSDIHCGDMIFTHVPLPHIGSGFSLCIMCQIPFIFMWKKTCYLGRVIWQGVLH